MGGDDLFERNEALTVGQLTNRGSSGGTFTRAKRRSHGRSGRVTTTAKFSDRCEMYGNGWPGSTASGVSTGKMRSVEDLVEPL